MHPRNVITSRDSCDMVEVYFLVATLEPHFASPFKIWSVRKVAEWKTKKNHLRATSLTSNGTLTSLGSIDSIPSLLSQSKIMQTRYIGLEFGAH